MSDTPRDVAERIMEDLCGGLGNLQARIDRAKNNIEAALTLSTARQTALVKALGEIIAEHDIQPFSYPEMKCFKQARKVLASADPKAKLMLANLRQARNMFVVTGGKHIGLKGKYRVDEVYALIVAALDGKTEEHNG